MRIKRSCGHTRCLDCGTVPGMHGDALEALQAAVCEESLAIALRLSAVEGQAGLVDAHGMLALVVPRAQTQVALSPQATPKKARSRSRPRSESPAALRRAKGDEARRRRSESPARASTSTSEKRGPASSLYGRYVHSSARREYLYLLEREVKDKVRALLHAPAKYHTLKVRLGSSGGSPVSGVELGQLLRSLGLCLQRVELETLVWSIRSFSDQATAKGVPLRLQKSEIMAYLAELRSARSVKFDDWAAIREQRRLSNRKRIAEHWDKALAGKKFALTAQELEGCVARLAVGLVPQPILDTEAEGRAHQWAYSEGGGTLHFRSRLKEKKEEYLRAERDSGKLSRSLVSEYLKDCIAKKSEGCNSFRGWLEKRSAAWAGRRKAFLGESYVY